jgi:hypothetical protein
MAANRWKLITVSAGGVVLLLMLLAASFSLGVYVGEHGWTRDGLSYSGPGGKPGADNRPDAGGPAPGSPAQAGTPQQPFAPAGLPPGRPNLAGRVVRIYPQRIEVATANGIRVVILTAETRFLEQDGTPIALKDLKKGDQIAVYGLLAEGDGGELRAEFVVRLPAKE